MDFVPHKNRHWSLQYTMYQQQVLLWIVSVDYIVKSVATLYQFVNLLAISMCDPIKPSISLPICNQLTSLKET